jgi:hypothetical protein
MIFMRRAYFSLFLGCLSCFSLAGCKDGFGTTTTVEGTVVEEGSTRRIPNAEVLLIKQKRESATAMGRQTVMHVNADEKGDFSFSFEANGDYYYTAEAKAEHYYDGGEGGSIKSGMPNKNVEIKLIPKGYVRFLLVNEEPKDTIQRYKMNGVEAFYNLHTDTTYYLAFLGNTNTSLGWWITKKDGVENHYLGEIFTPALDTVEFTIKY